MTPKQWAEKLNGREYCNEVSREEQKQMSDDGIIAVFGASDDLLEFAGALNDEVGAYEGTTVRIFQNTKAVKIFDEEENKETAEYNRKQIEKMLKVKATWCPEDENDEVYASWEIDTAIPHEHFDIMEDGELYCRGIVFHVRDVPIVEK